MFNSFGTPLSNDAEERQWRKYVHRAINVRNRNPTLTVHKCRLCGEEDESMLHLVRCLHTKGLWKNCLKFCHKILEAPDMTDRPERAIIFNQDKDRNMLPEAACAFIRHAFNIFYHDFANVEKGHIFVWQKVYYRALTAFRRAAMRYAGKIRLQHAHRIYPDLTAEVSEESRKNSSI